MGNVDTIAELTTSAQTLAMPERHNVAAEGTPPEQVMSPAEVELQKKVQIVGRAPEKLLQNVEKGAQVVRPPGLRTSQKAKWASVILALFGLGFIGASFLLSGNPALSRILALAGISIILISILLYFVSPSRLIRSDVSDAVAISDVELVNTLLAPIAGDSKGIYIPSSRVGTTQVFIPTQEGQFYPSGNSTEIMNVSESGKNGIFITPPGNGLYSYAKSQGASFTNEGLEDEIKDVLVNGLELALKVDVTRDADTIKVRVHDMADSTLCHTIRQKGLNACSQVGCPICSFIACMVVEGTGRRAMISDVRSNGHAMDLTYQLM